MLKMNNVSPEFTSSVLLSVQYKLCNLSSVNCKFLEKEKARPIFLNNPPKAKTQPPELIQEIVRGYVTNCGCKKNKMFFEHFVSSLFFYRLCLPCVFKIYESK